MFSDTVIAVQEDFWQWQIQKGWDKVGGGGDQIHLPLDFSNIILALNKTLDPSPENNSWIRSCLIHYQPEPNVFDQN